MMLQMLTKPITGALAAAVMIVGLAGQAHAVLVGTANYKAKTDGFFLQPPPTSQLTLRLNGSDIFSIADGSTADGTSISLASVSPAALAALTAVLQDGTDDTISIFGFNLVRDRLESVFGMPGVVPDLAPNYTVDDVVLNVNRFEVTSIFVAPIPGIFPGGDIYYGEYDIDVDIFATQDVPVPGAIVAGASAMSLLGFIAWRREQS